MLSCRKHPVLVGLSFVLFFFFFYQLLHFVQQKETTTYKAVLYTMYTLIQLCEKYCKYFCNLFFYTDICSCLCLQYIYSTNKVIKNKSKCIFLISGIWSQQFLSHSIGVKWQMDCLSMRSSSQLHSHMFAAAVISTTLGCESVANVSCRRSWISNLTCISQPFSTKWRGLVLTLSPKHGSCARRKFLNGATTYECNMSCITLFTILPGRKW